jgi:serine phosphatase RsbU (regulator of sigma subunit)
MNLWAQGSVNELEELANGYNSQGRSAQAAEFYSKAGYAYWNKSNTSKAAEMFQKAYDLFKPSGNNVALFAVCNNLGIVYLEGEKFANAYTAFSNALIHAKRTKNIHDIFNTLINIGSVSIELTNYNEAVSKGNEALAVAKELNNLKSLSRCYSLLAESYEKNGDASSAYKYYEMFSTVDKKIKENEIEDIKNMSADEINKAHEKKRVTEIELKIKSGELKLTQDSLIVSERLSLERQMQVQVSAAQLYAKENQLKYERNIRTMLIVGFIVSIMFLLGLGLLLKQKFSDNKTLKKQKEEITLQHNKLDFQNKRITDSIFYSLRIQQAMLPNLTKYGKYFENFIFYKPKDIVSGDFYWYYEVEINQLVYRFIALVDCTGHGVPGAFMSMIGERLLSEIIIEHKIFDPAEILKEVNLNLRKELGEGKNKSMDGMDIALCRVQFNNDKPIELVFSGAKRPIYYHKNGTPGLELIECDHKSIGGFSTKEVSFTNKTIPVTPGDIVILFSDGVIDQQNFERNRFGSKKLETLIIENIENPLSMMKENIVNAFKNFMKDEEQRDDATLIGIKFS